MGDRQKLTAEWPDLFGVSVADHVEISAAVEPPFLELVADKAEGEGRAIDIEIEIRDLFEKVRD